MSNKISDRALANMSKDTIRLNPQLTTAAAHNASQTGHYQLNPSNNPMVECAPTGKRIRQESKPLLNKLETDFWKEFLEFRYPKARAQALRFKLGNGIHYKPDFVDLSVQPVKAWEVKGPHAFRGGFENLKVAAHQYPEVRWILVWQQDGEWKQQEVLP